MTLPSTTSASATFEFARSVTILVPYRPLALPPGEGFRPFDHGEDTRALAFVEQAQSRFAFAVHEL
jgi:hypothetical protein